MIAEAVATSRERQARRPQAHAGLIREAQTHAADIGVNLIVEHQEEQGRLTFCVDRGHGAPGTGAAAIRHLLELADAADVPVAIDVAESIPALIRYYWRFGFRAFSEDGHGEEEGLAELVRRRDGALRRHGAAHQFGVTFMWRDVPAKEHP